MGVENISLTERRNTEHILTDRVEEIIGAQIY
jgi:hypothetical protein